MRITLLTLQTSLAGGTYGTTAKEQSLYSSGGRIESLPNVEAAASAIVLPVEAGVDLPFSIAGKPPAQGDYNGDEQWRFASPHYPGPSESRYCAGGSSMNWILEIPHGSSF